MGFQRQEHWSGLTFPSPGDLPDPGIKPVSPALAADFFTSEPSAKPSSEVFAVIHLLSCVQIFATPMNCSTPGIPVPHYLPEYPQVHIYWISVAIQPSHPLPPSSPIAFNLSQHQGLFQSVGCSHKVTKVFSFSVNTSNDCLGLISFRIDRFDLLAVQETLKSLFQHSLKASVLQCSAFFISQLSYPYLITGKTIVWIICTFATLSLFFNMLPRFVIAFLPTNKCLLISWLQSPSAVILEPPKICHCFLFFPVYLPWSDGTGCTGLCFLNVEF